MKGFTAVEVLANKDATSRYWLGISLGIWWRDYVRFWDLRHDHHLPETEDTERTPGSKVGQRCSCHQLKTSKPSTNKKKYLQKPIYSNTWDTQKSIKVIWPILFDLWSSIRGNWGGYRSGGNFPRMVNYFAGNEMFPWGNSCFPALEDGYAIILPGNILWANFFWLVKM